MISIDYKILFEVRILHDYYLTDNSGDSFFSFDEEKKKMIIQNKIKSQSYNIQNDLKILISPQDKSLMRGLRIIKVDTCMGFLVAMEVISEPDHGSGEDTFYRPFIQVDQDKYLTFGLGLANPLFYNFSNLRVNNPSNKFYFFKNDGIHSENSLSSPIKTLKSGEEYQMGDLAQKNRKVITALEANKGKISFWQELEGNGFVNQNDLSIDLSDPFFLNWISSVGRLTHPLVGLIKISLYNNKPLLSPLKPDGYLTTIRKPGKRPVHPVFEIRFLSRSTYWRYKKTDGFTEEEIDLINE